MKKFGLLILLVLLSCSFTKIVSSAAYKTEDSYYHVADIKAHLLYERSGALSKDLTEDIDFEGWNTPIGEGPAIMAGPANDILIYVVIKGPGERSLDTPLIITAKNSEGKILESRNISNILADTTSYHGMLIKESTCEGEITISAVLGKSTRMESLVLNCGE